MYLLSPSYMLDKQVNRRNNRHLFSPVSYSPFIPDFNKYSMIFESLYLLVFKFGISYSITRLFYQSNCQVLVIHELVFHLQRAGKLLDNRFPSHPMSIFYPSIKSLRLIPVINLLFTKSISAVICVRPRET